MKHWWVSPRSVSKVRSPNRALVTQESPSPLGRRMVLQHIHHFHLTADKTGISFVHFPCCILIFLFVRLYHLLLIKCFSRSPSGIFIILSDIHVTFNNYYLLTGCKGRTRKCKPKVFHTARACEGCLENQGLVFPGTARAPS